MSTSNLSATSASPATASAHAHSARASARSSGASSPASSSVEIARRAASRTRCGIAQGAAIPRRPPDPRGRQVGRVAQQGHGPLEARVGLRRVHPQRLELGQLHQERAVRGRQLHRLEHEGHCLVQGRQGAGVRRRGHQLVAGSVLLTGDQQVPGGLARHRGSALGEHPAHPAVQRQAHRLRDLVVRRVPQQRVPEPQTALPGGEERTGADLRRHLLGPAEAQVSELVVVEPSARHGQQPRHGQRAGAQGVERRAHERHEAGRRPRLPADQGTSPLRRQERVALRRRHHLRHPRGIEARDLLGQPSHLLVVQGAERELGEQPPPGAHRVQQVVEGRPVRQRPAGQHDEDRPVDEPSAHVGQEVQAGRVRRVGVVEHEHHRTTRRPPQEPDHGLEEPDPLEVGRGQGVRERRQVEPGVQVGHEPGQHRGPGGRRRRPLERRDQGDHELGPGPQRGGTTEVERRRRRRTSSLAACEVRELGDEARLADPGLSRDDDDAGLAAAGPPPGRAQRGPLGGPPDQRCRGRALVGPGHLGRPAPGAQLLGEVGELLARLGPQLAGEPVDVSFIGTYGARPVAGRVEQHHQPTHGLVGVGVKHELPPRPADRLVDAALRTRAPRQRLEEVEHRAPVRVPGLEHPVVDQSGEQLGRAGVRRLGEPARPDELGDLVDVEAQLGVVAEADPVPVEHEVVLRGDAEGAAYRPDCGAQAAPGAGVQDVRPERGGHHPARVLAPVQGQPGQEHPGAPAGRRRQLGSVSRQPQVTQQLHPQHGATVRRVGRHEALTERGV